MRSLQFPFSYSERLSNVARALLLALLSTLFVVFPTSGLEPATAAPNAAAITFNDGTCDLSTAGYLGSGSSADPYMVSDSDALWEVTDCSMTASAAAHFQITNDIDVSQAASASTTSPIGYDASGDISFSGVIDGGNNVVSGISMSTTSYGVGLFAYLHNATISNLAIGGSFVTTTGGTDEKYSAGALAIRADGSLDLSSISNQASVTGNRHVGGLVGQVRESANINFSRNTGVVSGTSHFVGGLVGYVVNDANIVSSYNTGPVSGSSGVGGLVGYVDEYANITSSHNTGKINGSTEVAGLVGWVRLDADIRSSYNAGTVSGQTSIGGLLGYVNRDANIISSNNTGKLLGASEVGGLVGYVWSVSNIILSINTGAILGWSNIGGLVGYANSDATITSSQNTAAINGFDYQVGGLVGYVFGDFNTNLSYNSGDVSGATRHVGGLVGLVSGDTSVLISSNRGDVSGGSYDVGGLIGEVSGNVVMDNSDNSGDVSSPGRRVGGLVGDVGGDASLLRSNNSGDISGSSDVGGLIGDASSSSSITFSHNTGDITGTGKYIGGLIGTSGGITTLHSSYNQGDVRGVERIGGLIGESTFSNIISSNNQGTITGTEDDIGGLIGLANGDTALLDTFNRGDITGFEAVGGLLGHLASSFDLTISYSYNTGAVVGTDIHIGGLIGYSDGDTTLFSSFNRGDVSGVDNVGGLIGYVYDDANLTAVSLGFNIGQITASGGVAGGLVGQIVDHDATFQTVYNAGSVGGSSNSDGILGTVSGTVTITTSSAFTSEASLFATTTPAADLRQASTFAGFNFPSEWGFGSCTDNRGFPMLTSFTELLTYNSVACVSPPPQSNPSPGSTPAPAPVLQPLPAIDQTRIQTAAGTEQLLTGQRFELIRSATINGMPATISQLTATSLVLSIPALASGNYSLDLETSNGRISFQGLVEVGGTSLGSAQLGSTFSVITGLNPRSSWLNRTALAELEEIFKGQSVVTCISYNDRPGVITRKKALSRAMHACRIADQLGLETRVFVYGKAPELSDTVKILFR